MRDALAHGFVNFRPGLVAHRSRGQEKSDAYKPNSFRHVKRHRAKSCGATSAKQSPSKSLGVDVLEKLVLIRANVSTLNPKKLIQASVKHGNASTPRMI